VESPNPYKAPTTNVNFVEAETPVPDDIALKIKSAWIAGLVSVGITAAFVLYSFFAAPVMGIDSWALVDVAIMTGLSFGVFRKSRTCAILLFLLFVANKVFMWMESGSLAGWPMALAFTACFVMGVQGTFQYHSWKRGTVST